jgi:trans-2,3-dihydro-3-hydroxyanthranilate isomerase
MTRRFFTLDVFTDAPLTGNPLAVVLDGEGLDDARMQAIAGEFNLAETVFVMAPANTRHRASLRIFTPRKELPFAGHPTVGTAALLALLDGKPDQIFGLEEKAGIVPCVAERRAKDRAYVRFRAPLLPEKLTGAPDANAAAKALGVNPSEVLDVSRWSAGVPFDFVELDSLDALARARIGADFNETFADSAAPYVRVEDWTKWRTRNFAPQVGIPEDPATGSAAAAFAGLVHARARPGDGDHDIVIDQGVEMGRPSRIGVQLICEGVFLKGVEISGEAVIVSEGKLRL